MQVHWSPKKLEDTKYVIPDDNFKFNKFQIEIKNVLSLGFQIGIKNVYVKYNTGGIL